MSSTLISWRQLSTQIVLRRAHLALSLRVTIAALLAFAVSNLMSLRLPLWTVLTAIILTQANFGRSVKATLDYSAGTIGGAIYAGAVSVLVPHSNDLSLAVVLALAVAPLALLGAINPSFAAAPFTGALVLLVPGLSHLGPIESAIDRVLEVAIGGIAALAVSLLVAPARAQTHAIEAAARALDLMARSLPDLFAGLIEPGDPAAFARLQDSVGEAVVKTETIASEARHERIGFLAVQPELGPLLRTVLRLRHDLVMIGRAAAAPLPDAVLERLGSPLARVAESVPDHLRRTGEALAARREPPGPDAAEAAFDDYSRTSDAARRERLTLSLPADAVERVFTLRFALDQMRQHFRDLDRCVRDVARRR
jgi:uncharacterized membrane protein YccC